MVTRHTKITNIDEFPLYSHVCGECTSFCFIVFPMFWTAELNSFHYSTLSVSDSSLISIPYDFAISYSISLAPF